MDRWFWRDSVRPIRGASEREAVERLRYRVYVNEMDKPYPHADHVRQRLSDPLDDVSLILGAFDGDGLFGTVRSTSAKERILQELYGTPLQLNDWVDVEPSSLLVCSRLTVEPRMRRTLRASLALMCGMYFFGREQDISVCLCSTAAPLVGFFKHFGFRPYGLPFTDPDSGREQTCLSLLLEDVEHLQGTNSPFLAEALPRVNAPPQLSWVERVGASVLGVLDTPAESTLS